MSNSVEMVSLRSVSVRGLSGHTVFIPAKTPTLVPRPLVRAAMDKGCVPKDEAELLAMQDAVHQEEKSAQEHLEAIIEKIGEIVANDTDGEHFTAGGMPRVESIEGMLGYDITSEQRDEAWAIYSERNKQANLDGGGTTPEPSKE